MLKALLVYQITFTVITSGVWYIITDITTATFCLLAGLLCSMTDGIFIFRIESFNGKQNNNSQSDNSIVSVAIQRILLTIAGFSFIIYYLSHSNYKLEMLLAMISGWLGARLIGIAVVSSHTNQKEH